MLKRLILAASALMIAAPVMAHDRAHGRGHHRHHFNHGHHFHHFHPRPVVVVPPPRVYYAPAPVYSAPVYPAPVPQSSVSIRLHFPL
jgi:hypothetical protein